MLVGPLAFLRLTVVRNLAFQLVNCIGWQVALAWEKVLSKLGVGVAEDPGVTKRHLALGLVLEVAAGLVVFFKRLDDVLGGGVVDVEAGGSLLDGVALGLEHEVDQVETLGGLDGHVAALLAGLLNLCNFCC